MFDVSLPSGISGLSFDSPFLLISSLVIFVCLLPVSLALSALSFFC